MTLFCKRVQEHQNSTILYHHSRSSVQSRHCHCGSLKWGAANVAAVLLPENMVFSTDYGHLVNKSPSLHGRKSIPIPNFQVRRQYILSATSAQNFRFLLFMPSLGVRSPCPQKKTSSRKKLAHDLLYYIHDDVSLKPVHVYLFKLLSKVYPSF